MATRGDSVWATVSTPTGDYRYLAGKKHHKNLVFSNFDGAHLFRFEAYVAGDSLVNGEFLSGTHYRTAFSGRRLASMPTKWKSATQAATAKELTFSGIDARGDTMHWSSAVLENNGKNGLVLDVMGTWCPNCMDEARLLREFASDYPEVQFLSLAFERNTGADALARLQAFRSEMELPWEVLLGGKASKMEAANVLSAVDTVRSFPTTIFWPLKGEPTIHQGFNGPATGEGFEVERAFFRSELNRISGRSESR
jgi:thiol-disulfide isomerase/thioredoxin